MSKRAPNDRSLKVILASDLRNLCNDVTGTPIRELKLAQDFDALAQAPEQELS
ncbi:hypothetical protein ICA16_05475 [Pseudomonas anatoliensis]|uniref:hypothetical protein n=1 Tax=Pseudomonas anatoliensis TaxID=2710589 RepID=UPI001B31D5EA|nr:hypothetical protein [Pseudomonas anatoliensis]MBP5955106.1 hypothetical protein [Pseudomonas anatoliensis]